jgi:cysteine desulfuration protein SufE
MNYNDIKNSLNLIQDPVDKLDFVMELGKKLAPVPEDAVCTEILGCASFVQICQKDGRFYGRADSFMVRGIVAIILALVENKPLEEIKKMDLESEFNSLNLNFGAARLNGIHSMISFFDNL